MKGSRSNLIHALGASLALVASGAFVFACSADDEAEPTTTPDSGADVFAADSSAADVVDAADATVGDADADDDFVVPDASVVCSVEPCVTAISGYADGYCAVLKDGRAACWGANNNSRLGVDSENYMLSTPSFVEGLADVVQLSVGGETSCARVVDGKVYCWGYSDLLNAGSLPPEGGEPLSGSITTPTLQGAVPPAKDLSLGDRFACVTTSDGSLTCWGSNDLQELGRGPTDPYMPAPAGTATRVTRPVAAVFGAPGRTFALLPDARVMSWGANSSYGSYNFLLGRDSSEDPSGQPVIVKSLTGIRSIAPGNSHACALAGRFVDCWGLNDHGQLGRGTFENQSYLPGRSVLAGVTDKEDAEDAGAWNHVAGEHDVPVQVAVSGFHTCAVLGSGRVYCWGSAGNMGLLGPGVSGDGIEATPMRVDGFSGPVVALAGGDQSFCALLRTGAVECWGGNDRGQHGIGTTDQDPHPTPSRVSFSQ